MRPHQPSLATLALTLLLHLALSPAARAQTEPLAPHPCLDVNGAGAAYAAPDVVSIGLGAHFVEPTVAEAQSKVNHALAAAIDAVKSLGVPAHAIATSTISISPEYERRPPGEYTTPRRLLGYSASNELTIRLEDISLAGAVIDAALKAGANSLDDVTFGLTDPAPQHTEALRRAVADARRKADTIADAMNLTITGVAEISDTTRWSYGGGQSPFTQIGDDPETPIEPGQIAVSAAVFIRFNIAPKTP